MSDTVLSEAVDKQQAEWVWQRFSVPYDIPVVFTERAFHTENLALRTAIGRFDPRQRHRCFIFLDSGLSDCAPALTQDIACYFGHHADGLELVASPVVIGGGEAAKVGLGHVRSVVDTLLAHRIDRHGFVIAVGGGAMLDAVGFATAVTHRGIRHIRMPTTVLAQDDSGVGVKNGINYRGVKNLLGTFTPPAAVISDFALLETLPPRERISGMAEAVKVALIRDADFFTWIEENAARLSRFERDAVRKLVRRSAELHMRQIAHGGDPFEHGSGRPLDHGHWAAHKLEVLSRHELQHGEAVAIGIALDARYAVLAGILAPGTDERIARLLEVLGFRLWHPAMKATGLTGRALILDGLSEFREHLGGRLTVTLVRAIGQSIDVHDIDEARVSVAIRWLRDRGAAP